VAAEADTGSWGTHEHDRANMHRTQRRGGSRAGSGPSCDEYKGTDIDSDSSLDSAEGGGTRSPGRSSYRPGRRMSWVESHRITEGMPRASILSVHTQLKKHASLLAEAARSLRSQCSELEAGLTRAERGWSAAAKRSRSKDVAVIVGALENVHLRAAVEYLGRVIDQVGRVHPGTVRRLRETVWNNDQEQAEREQRSTGEFIALQPDPRWVAGDVIRRAEEQEAEEQAEEET